MAISSKEALEILKKGNKAYVEGKNANPHMDVARRESVVGGQEPFAIIVGCADSRAPVEHIFDTGIGDLFVIRVAGNVVDDPIMASIEYGVKNLGCKLVVVMGHESCGAVGAAVQGVEQGHLASITDRIKPAVEKAQKEQEGDNVLAAAIEHNAKNMAEEVKNSEPILKEMYDKNEFEVLPAYYSLSTGEVVFFDKQEA